MSDEFICKLTIVKKDGKEAWHNLSARSAEKMGIASGFLIFTDLYNRFYAYNVDMINYYHIEEGEKHYE